ncbi:MAG TPA: pyridoxamine 5'-phosphate oxidase family protein [Symbiobacteriaceae bacterium]|nr:pyridoxamine 5'-phosphate oxidase family protein [Symbiobacteriaceae bacterium]
MEHKLRRTDREMTSEETWSLLNRGYVGRLGIADPDGWPYVVPKMYAVLNGHIYFHGATAQGHTRAGVAANPRVCFEVDEPGPVFPTGTQGQCETSVGFESVILFGTCSEVTDEAEQLAALDALMIKYAHPAWERPQTYAPMLKATVVFKIAVERVTGKRRPVTVAEQWRHMFPTEV